MVVARTKKPKTSKAEQLLRKQAMSPVGYITTGLIMWILGYALGSLAIDSGSNLQWLGTIIAAVWGLARIIQGVRLAAKK